MRACAAILFFAAWPCFIHAQKSHSRENSPNFANGINENLIRLVPCVKNLGLSKCVGAYGAWRAEKSLEAYAYTEHSARFPWQRYYNVSDDELYSKLCDGAERLLQRRSLKLNLNEDYSLQLRVTENGSLNVDVLKSELASGRTSKKFEKYFYELVPFILLPGLLMSAVLPFFLPTLKMMTLGAGMLNNMALTGAVFTLLRNNAFNDKYEKKVIYLNNGYLNDKLEPLADSQSTIIVDGDFDKYSGKYPDKFATVETNDVKDFHFNGQEPLETENLISSDWLKQITGKDDVKVFQNNFVGNDWRREYDAGKQTEWTLPKRSEEGHQENIIFSCHAHDSEKQVEIYRGTRKKWRSSRPQTFWSTRPIFGPQYIKVPSHGIKGFLDKRDPRMLEMNK